MMFSLWPHLFFISTADGEYVSKALLVPDRCRFLHQEQMDTCKSYVYWHNIAKQVRSKHFRGNCGNEWDGIDGISSGGFCLFGGDTGVTLTGAVKEG